MNNAERKALIDIMEQVNDLEIQVTKIKEAQLKLETALNVLQESSDVGDMRAECLKNMLDIVNEKVDCLSSYVFGDMEEEVEDE